MKLGSKRISLGSKHISLKWTWTIVLVLAAGMAWGFRGPIVSVVRHWTGNLAAGGNGAAQTGDDSAGADAHHHHAGDEGNPTSIHLTSQARANIGLTDEFLKSIALQKFIRTISVPAIVAEKPGRSKISVAAPMTGIVTDVYTVKGEAVQSTKLLFKIRLTHEDLVQAQTTFLKTLGDLDVEKREISRLKIITDKGVVAGKVLLEHEYSQEKLQAELKRIAKRCCCTGCRRNRLTRFQPADTCWASCRSVCRLWMQHRATCNSTGPGSNRHRRQPRMLPQRRAGRPRLWCRNLT